VPLIIWTFDPLQSRNAHLNINKLGAVSAVTKSITTAKVVHRFRFRRPSEPIICGMGWGVGASRESVIAGNRPTLRSGRVRLDPRRHQQGPGNIRRRTSQMAVARA